MAKQDRVKLRFSTNRLKKLCDSLSEEQKEFVVQNGFGHFLNLSKFTVSIPMLEFVMAHFKLGINEFSYNGRRIRFTKRIVEQVLGFSSGDVPVVLENVSADLIEESKTVSVDYIVGSSKPSIAQAIALCLSENNEDDFMRSFMLVALATFISPNTQNSVDLRLLSFLMRAGEIRNYDWASFAFEYIKTEVERFQMNINSNDENVRHSSYFYGSCLPLLLVVYMDFLDLKSDFGNMHEISYDLPRFCNVKSEDFTHCYEVDRVRFPASRYIKFGVVAFRDFSLTPYGLFLDDIPPVAPNAVDDNAANENNPISPIINHNDSSGAGEPSGPPVFPTVEVLDVDAVIEPIVRQYCQLLVNDLGSLFHSSGSSSLSLPERLVSIVSSRMISFSSEVLSIVSLDKSLHEQDGFVPLPNSTESEDKNDGKGSSKHSGKESQNDRNSENEIYEIESSSLNKNPETKTITDNNVKVLQSIDKGFINEIEELNLGTSEKGKGVNDSPSSGTDQSNPISKNSKKENESMETETNPEVELQSNPETYETETTILNESLNEAIGGINIAMSYDTSTPNKEVNILDYELKKRTSTSIIDKRKRKKRAAVIPNEGGIIKIKASKAVRDTFGKYIQTEFLKSVESPTFVMISGFHCSYKDLRESLKARGHIFDDVMALYSQSFNISQKEIQDDRLSRKKICFSPFLGQKLMHPSATFDAGSLKNELQRIQKEFNIVQSDLLFFPICHEEHWFLICVNLLHKEICFFTSTHSPSLELRDNFMSNVVANFQSSCKVAEIYDKNLVVFPKNSPECPQQINNYDCGLYVMLFMDHFDGKSVKFFHPNDINQFRMIVANRLINHSANEIDVTRFE